VDYGCLSPGALVRECLASSSEQAWAEFLRRFHPLIMRVVVRVARRWGETRTQLLDELVQETYLKICQNRASLMHGFQSVREDAVFAYIKVFTANLVQDYFKSRNAKKRDGELRSETLESVECSSARVRPVVQLIERDLLVRQIETCLASLDLGANGDRDREIFWLYYRCGLPAREIASIETMGLSTKGVESTIGRITRELRTMLGESQSPSNVSRRIEKGISAEESL
jgi:RNA polymerase sigma-70 factor (ECF subfamily)